MTQEKEVDFTLLCCTYNRADDLKELLDSAVVQQSGAFRYEVVVVDNNSRDDTAAAVQEYVARYPALIRYLFEGRQGKSYALNTGLRECRGRVYTIADDDLIYPPDYLRKLHAAFNERPYASVIAGKTLPLWKSPPPTWLTQKHWSAIAMSDYGNIEFETGKENVRTLLSGAYRRDHVMELDGYNPELGVAGERIGGVEDADIMNRLYAAGYKGVYRPELEVFHKVEPHRITRAYHRRWHRDHGRQHVIMHAGDKAGKRFLGVPGYLCSAAIGDALRYLQKSLMGAPDQAFVHETRLWFFAGYFQEVQRRRADKTSS